MLALSHPNLYRQAFHVLRGYHYEILTLRKKNEPLAGESGSAAHVHRMLGELVELTDQKTPGAAVLELQIGDILTRAFVEALGKRHYLSITAMLPKCAQSLYMPVSFTPELKIASGSDPVDFLWHADEGRYVVSRQVPVAGLPDEKALMDAILGTADLAQLYSSYLSVNSPDRSAAT